MKPVFGFPQGFELIGQGYIWIFPIPVLIMAVMFVITYLLLNKCRIGRYIYGLGGISISGGEGKITGVVAGVLIMGVLANGMIIIGLSDYVQQMVQGLVLIAAVAFDLYAKQTKNKPVPVESSVTAA